MFIPLRNVPYPSTPDSILPLLLTQSSPAIREDLVRYGQMHWNHLKMEARIELAAKWGQQHGVPVWCGEFGALRDYAPPDARARWIADMRKTLEHDGIGLGHVGTTRAGLAWCGRRMA